MDGKITAQNQQLPDKIDLSGLKLTQKFRIRRVVIGENINKNTVIYTGPGGHGLLIVGAFDPQLPEGQGRAGIVVPVI